MRRKEREVKERAAIEKILRACKVCRLAMNGEDGVPYVVPLNFGYTWNEEQPVFYLHSAQSGRKLDLLGKDARVCFEMDCGYVLEGEADDACTYTNRYASVIGTGRCELVTSDEEKEAGLRCLMQHVAGDQDWKFDPHWMGKTAVLRVRTEQLTAKRH
ncbi:pyridoxamine 5'-phosphate oxidase family protein [Butyricicoccus pullicaecorum]|uniref:Pyridoxamine 5'-phosphate oxidase putative domain-containing protein n=1 Tax=Butyricicoccus pullicaecorum 1.2 TaxID=1203606 RepID=R8VZI0_9FIRM|nr:pyridoxamine 5'-phosphate oxidase family protein [Butyricicoccus pullicaecorum]EOQ37859.1 hypothetical protein HMPREF1526_00883 [Butyricicoccus pullicaecorum 1.2]SKA60469.1 hypothetical protein SAMN02745978_01862 [Butyricicoccus pullicaecorum DSM 23266]